MPISFWVKRFFTIVIPVFALLAAINALRGKVLEANLIESAVWAIISATIFVVTRIVRLRRGERCALCKDSPEDASPPSL